MLKTKTLKFLVAVFLSAVMFLAAAGPVYGHGLFVLISPLTEAGHEFGSPLPAQAVILADIGETVVVTGGWGYNFLGPDGVVHTGFYHRVTLINPHGTRTVLDHSWFHQRDGRDDRSGAPIRIVPFAQIGTGAFPSGGRHNVFLQTTFVPESDGYYQVVFERFRPAGNFATEGHANYGLLMVDTAHTVVMVGEPDHTDITAGFANPIGTGRLEIVPLNDIGRLSHDYDEYLEGTLLLDGVPLSNQRIRVNIPGVGVLDGSGGHNDWLRPDDFSTDSNGNFRVPIPRMGPTSPGHYSVQVPALQIIDTPGTLLASDGSYVYGNVTRGTGDEAVTTWERITYTRVSETFLYHFFIPAAEYRIEAAAPRPVERPDSPPPADTTAQAEPLGIGSPQGNPQGNPNTFIGGVEIELPVLFDTVNIIGFIGGSIMLFAAGLFVGLGLSRKKREATK